MVLTKVRNLRRRVVALRAKEREQRALTEVAQLVLESCTQWTTLKAAEKALAKATDKRAKTESLLRLAAVEEYKACGNKNPVPGVHVKVMHKLEYSICEATAWAQEHAPTLIWAMLHVKTFEKVAPTMPGAPIKVLDEPKGFLDPDLSEAKTA